MTDLSVSGIVHSYSYVNYFTNYDKVKEFHSKFDIPILDTPTVPSEDRICLRESVITEEYNEVMKELFVYDHGVDAIDFSTIKPNIDLRNVAKELADLLYVVYGTALEFGIDIDRVFDKVHLSNMSKLGADGKPVRREDGKVLKGPNYQPVNLDDLL